MGRKICKCPRRKICRSLKKRLKTGGNKDFQVIELPGLNHQFQHCYMGLPAESRAIEETFAPDALNDHLRLDLEAFTAAIEPANLHIGRTQSMPRWHRTRVRSSRNIAFSGRS